MAEMNIHELDNWSAEFYQQVCKTTTTSFCKWYETACEIYDKDQLQTKFDSVREHVVKLFDRISDELESMEVEQLLNEIIAICNELKISYPEIELENNPTIRDVLWENLKELRKLKTKNTLALMTSKFKLKSPGTHKRISETYEEFQRGLSKRRNGRDNNSTALFHKEHGIPEIIISRH